jgi:hypothetical protein
MKKSYKLANLKTSWIADQVVYPCGLTLSLGNKIAQGDELFYECFTSFIPNSNSSIGYVNKAVLQFLKV